MSNLRTQQPNSNKEKNQWLPKQGSFFRDQLGELFAEMQDVDGTNRIVALDSEDFQALLIRRYHSETGKPLKSNELVTLVRTVKAWAKIAPIMTLHVRVAERSGGFTFYYDLNNEGAVVEIMPGRVYVIDNHGIAFRRFGATSSQVIPAPSDPYYAPLSGLFSLVNIINPLDQLLFKVYLISCFIPTIPHPLVALFGQQGAAKTTAARVIKRLVDPSGLEVTSFSGGHDELVRLFTHNHMIVFDNITKISQAQSDLLCTAVSGATQSLRKKYTNSEEVFFCFKCCIVLTGINRSVESPDLLDRTLQFDLERVSGARRRDERELWHEFEVKKPLFMGAIFETLAHAMELYGNVRVTDSHRLADFHKWGVAISMALNHSQEEFEEALARNKERIHHTVVDANPVLQAVITFMNGREEWDGRMLTLLDELKKINPTGLPKDQRILSGEITKIEQNLNEAGIRFQKKIAGKNSVSKIALKKENPK